MFLPQKLLLALSLCLSAQAKVFDYDLHCTVTKGNDDVMVLMHGYGGNHKIVEAIKPHVEETLISFNFPDHSLDRRSVRPESTTFGSFEEIKPALYVLKTAIIENSLQKIDLYGFSAGGGVAINLISALNTSRFDTELKAMGITLDVKKQMLTAIQNGKVILDVPLKSVEEIIAYRGLTEELEIIGNRYKENNMRPIDSLQHLPKLNIIVHFQVPDEILSNQDDQLYISRLKAYNAGQTYVVIGENEGHNGCHTALWNFYKNLE